MNIDIEICTVQCIFGNKTLNVISLYRRPHSGTLNGIYSFRVPRWLIQPIHVVWKNGMYSFAVVVGAFKISHPRAIKIYAFIPEVLKPLSLIRQQIFSKCLQSWCEYLTLRYDAIRLQNYNSKGNVEKSKLFHSTGKSCITMDTLHDEVV